MNLGNVVQESVGKGLLAVTAHPGFYPVGPGITVSDCLVGAESCVTLWEKGSGGILVLLLMLVFVKRKQDLAAEVSQQQPVLLARGQLEQILCLALLTAQISSERSIPPLGRVGDPGRRLPLPPHLWGQ